MWAPQDSNLGPTGYEPAALTAELGARRGNAAILALLLSFAGPVSAGSRDSADVGAPARRRILALDVLRGFAVGGILVANVEVFFGLMFMPAAQAAALPTFQADRIAMFLEHVLIEGKFYSIFSLLFGIGFGLQLARAGEAAVPLFRRRLRILLAIGAVHAFLIWAGDILMLYALLGLLMPWFARKSDRSLLRWTAGLLATPTILYIVTLGIWYVAAGTPAAPPPGDGPGIPPDILERLLAMGTGGFADAFIGNLLFVVGRWADLFVSMRFPKVLGMFVLGLWAVRHGIVSEPGAHRDLLVRWRRLGLLIGLPANLLAAWAFLHWPYMPPSAGALMGVAGQAIGFPMLAIGYACTVALWVIDGRQLILRMAPVGKMALSNYLMHSIVCVTLSYGFGLGLWMRVGALAVTGIALAIVLVQIPISTWWLGHYRYGPAEWIWRRLTYRQPLPLRTSDVDVRTSKLL